MFCNREETSRNIMSAREDAHASDLTRKERIMRKLQTVSVSYVFCLLCDKDVCPKQIHLRSFRFRIFVIMTSTKRFYAKTCKKQDYQKNFKTVIKQSCELNDQFFSMYIYYISV